MLSGARARFADWHRSTPSSWSLPTVLAPLLPSRHDDGPASAPPRPPSPVLPPEILHIVFDYLVAGMDDLVHNGDHLRQLSRLALVSQAFLPFARLHLYSHLALKIADDEKYAGRWFEMSKSDDDAIHDRYARWTTDYDDLARSLVANPHLAAMVRHITLTMDDTGHNFIADPAADLLEQLLATCTSLDKLVVGRPGDRQSSHEHSRTSLLLRAVAGSGVNVKTLYINAMLHAVDAGCPTCAAALGVFLASATASALDDMSLHIEGSVSDHPVTISLNLLRATRLRLRGSSAALPCMIALLAPDPSFLTHLDLAIISDRPLVDPTFTFNQFTSLSSLSIHLPNTTVSNLKNSFTPLIAALNTSSPPSLAHLSLSYTPGSKHQYLLATRPHLRSFIRLEQLVPPTITHLNCSRFLLARQRVLEFLESGPRPALQEVKYWVILRSETHGDEERRKRLEDCAREQGVELVEREEDPEKVWAREVE